MDASAQTKLASPLVQSQSSHLPLAKNVHPAPPDISGPSLDQRKVKSATHKPRLSKAQRLARSRRTEQMLQLCRQFEVNQRDIGTLNQLIQQGVKVNHKDPDGHTALHHAVCKYHMAIIRLLLAHPYIDINTADHEGRTPLYHAAKMGRTEIIQLLLEQTTIDANKANRRGNTPLIVAAYNGRTAVVQLLLGHKTIDAHGANLYGHTALTLAVYCNRTAVAHLLSKHLNSNSDINSWDHNGNTRLLVAVITGQTETVRNLLKAPSIDVNKASKYGSTPLFWAAYNRRTDIFNLLRTHKDIKPSCNDPDVAYWFTQLQYLDKAKQATTVSALAIGNQLTQEQCQALTIQLFEGISNLKT